MAHMISVSDDKFVVSHDDGRGQPVGTIAESILVEDIVVLTCADADPRCDGCAGPQRNRSPASFGPLAERRYADGYAVGVWP
jgi:hypothetical protein